MDRLSENLIEWITDSDVATVTFSQKRYITKFKKLCEKYPEMARIEAINDDGSVYGHISIKGIKLSLFGTENGRVFPVSDPEEDDGK